uniref:Uncharacterized protein n=1 Tax=Zooxanthella nutricula TaxID=1333877 RepID=A0A7S2VPS0_9DINO
MVHLDYVRGMLAGGGLEAAAAGVEVVGLLDSPLWIDVPSFSGAVSLGDRCAGVYSYANISHAGDACTGAHPEEPWKCIMGQYRMPHVDTPYFLVASQYDSYQLTENVGHKPTTQAERAYAERFASQTLHAIESLRARWPSTARRQNAVFSWACYNHATTLSDRGFERDTCGGETIHAAVLQFLAPGAGPARQEWVDKCKGFACGPGCTGARGEDGLPQRVAAIFA